MSASLWNRFESLNEPVQLARWPRLSRWLNHWEWLDAALLAVGVVGFAYIIHTQNVRIERLEAVVRAQAVAQ